MTEAAYAKGGKEPLRGGQKRRQTSQEASGPIKFGQMDWRQTRATKKGGESLRTEESVWVWTKKRGGGWICIKKSLITGDLET